VDVIDPLDLRIALDGDGVEAAFLAHLAEGGFERAQRLQRGAAAQVLDSETREISVPGLNAAPTVLGTPSIRRARTSREFQSLRADADAVPIAGREFNRTEHLLVRVPAYGPAGTTPTLSVHMLNRTGAVMNELKAEPSPKTGEQQIDLPLAALPPGEYVIEIKAGDQGADATELVGFRVTG